MPGERSVLLRWAIPRRVGLGRVGHAGKEATVKTEQTVAAGSTVGEMGFNALIVNLPIANTLIVNSQTIDTLMIDALMLVTLGRLRSRTGSSNPVVFNLSIAQVLRLFSHWSHISLI
jgi:hypothetical protein